MNPLMFCQQQLKNQRIGKRALMAAIFKLACIAATLPKRYLKHPCRQSRESVQETPETLGLRSIHLRKAKAKKGFSRKIWTRTTESFA
jgi:hypothetical protein